MGKRDKLTERLISAPKNFRYSEAKSLLESMGFNEFSKGKTSGSRMRFYRESDKASILLHKPHPNDEMKLYAVKQLIESLKELGEL